MLESIQLYRTCYKNRKEFIMAIPQNGIFLPTTVAVDVSSLKGKSLDSDEFKQLIVKLYQNLNNISIITNYKDSGIYDLALAFNNQSWFPNPTASASADTPAPYRDGSRVTINFGALPNAGTKFVAHGIAVTATTTFTRIYATATDTTGLTAIPIPFVSVSGSIPAGNTEIYVDNTNVYITTTGNGSNYNVCYVVIEYISN